MMHDPSQAFPVRNHLRTAAGVFLLAAGVRLLFLLTSPDRRWPHAINYEGDAVIWARAAELFARGTAPDDGVPHRFYAVAHLIRWLSPDGRPADYLWFKVGWCLWSAVGCAGAYLVFARNLPRRPALIATAFCIFSFGSYVLATSLNVEGLYTPILMLVIGGTFELRRKPSWRLAALLAIANALALLTREEHLVLLTLLSGFLFWSWRWGRKQMTAPGIATSRRVTMPIAIVAGAVALCLPYSIHATRATHAYNNVAKYQPNYDAAADVKWPADARAYIESLPAFVRAKTVDLVTRRCREADHPVVTPALAEGFLIEFFGYRPEPLKTPVFIASHGPMSFALSNHPASNGAFSRLPLETRAQQKDPRLNLSLPEHLRIFNHGYAVGWSYIKSDVARWLVNVGKKLGHAYQGFSLGFTAYNLPLGRYGERRPCDLLTPIPGTGWLWQLTWGMVLVTGGIVAWKEKTGSVGPWLLVIVYKTAIVAAFYGYARQMTSILPVFFVFAALGVDRLWSSLAPWFARTVGVHLTPAATTTVFLLAACATDLHAGSHPAEYNIVGPVQPLPRWGEQAFSSNGHIELRPPESK